MFVNGVKAQIENTTQYQSLPFVRLSVMEAYVGNFAVSIYACCAYACERVYAYQKAAFTQTTSSSEQIEQIEQVAQTKQIEILSDKENKATIFGENYRAKERIEELLTQLDDLGSGDEPLLQVLEQEKEQYNNIVAQIKWLLVKLKIALNQNPDAEADTVNASQAQQADEALATGKMIQRFNETEKDVSILLREVRYLCRPRLQLPSWLKLRILSLVIGLVAALATMLMTILINIGILPATFLLGREIFSIFTLVSFLIRGLLEVNDVKNSRQKQEAKLFKAQLNALKEYLEALQSELQIVRKELTAQDVLVIDHADQQVAARMQFTSCPIHKIFSMSKPYISNLGGYGFV